MEKNEMADQATNPAADQAANEAAVATARGTEAAGLTEGASAHQRRSSAATKPRRVRRLANSASP
jgi:hypothetical protein